MSDDASPVDRPEPLHLPTEPRSWRELERDASGCTLCRLCDVRTKVVFGEGSQTPSLVVIGDAPARTDDLLGKPFAGAPGNLLDNVLLESGFDRDEEVYVTTVVKCHPGRTTPDREVVDACTPYLLEQIVNLAPKVIVTLGPVAAQLLLRRPVPLDKAAGFRFDVFDGITLIPTYHPTAVIKGNHQAIASLRRDFMTARAVLDGRLSTGKEAMAELRARTEREPA